MPLKDLAALCIDTRDVNLAVASARRMRDAGFASIMLFAHDADAARSAGGQDLNIVTIPTLRSIDDYSRFVTFEIPRYLRSDHFIIFQWDGFCLTPSLWWDGFLEYDYIGAPWVKEHRHGMGPVGNGGFSLRSRRLANHVAQSGPLEADYPEDLQIARLATQPERFQGFKIAPVEIARHFSVEHTTYYPREATENLMIDGATFGFHGWFNFHIAFDDGGLVNFIVNIMTEDQRRRILGKWEHTALLVNLHNAGRCDCAREVAMITKETLGLHLDAGSANVVQDVIDAVNHRRTLR